MGPAETLTGMLTERIGRPAWRLSGLWKEEHVGLICLTEDRVISLSGVVTYSACMDPIYTCDIPVNNI